MAASIDSFLNSFNTKFEAPVRSHLKNVYASLTMTVASATPSAPDLRFALMAAVAACEKMRRAPRTQSKADLDTLTEGGVEINTGESKTELLVSSINRQRLT